MWCVGVLNEEYRARMYDLLKLYALPLDKAQPVVCVDEKSKQLLGDKRPSLPGKVKKIDYEYERFGTQNIFMGVEPLAGKRVTSVTDTRKKEDFAIFVKELVDVHYPDALCIHIVVDNLNTHFRGSFVKTFGEEEADRILARVQFHYTPKHASWLNMAEIEIGIMDRQCLNRRIPTKQMLIDEILAWEQARNAQKKTIQWTLTPQKADEKLGKHYV